MGLSPFKTSSIYKRSEDYESMKVSPFDPDPSRFKIDSYIELGNYLLLTVIYPNCINYEGKKLLLYSGVSIEDIKQRRELDPHFTDKELSPVARFKPDQEGLKLALKLINL